MIRQETFETAVDVLVKAYFEGTLVLGNACGCAVGNILAHANGYNIKFVDVDSGNFSMQEIVWEDEEKHELINLREWDLDDWWYGQSGGVNPNCSLIAASGYSPAELAKIELAFERYNDITVESTDAEEQFKGLMNVMDVLFEIHQVEEEKQEQYKQKFVTA